MVALLGDSISGDQYVWFELPSLERATLFLVSDANARLIGMKRCTVAATDLVNNENAAFWYQDLSWDDTEYPNTPIIAPVDKLQPIPPSYKVDHGALLTTALAAPTVTDGVESDAYWKGLRVAHRAWQHVAAVFGGRTLNNVDNIPDNNWNNGGLGQQDVNNLFGVLNSNIYFEYVDLYPTDPLVLEAKPLIEQKLATMLLYEAESLTTPETPPAGTRPNNVTPDQTLLSTLTGAIGGMTEFMKSSKEGSQTNQRKKKAALRQTEWGLCIKSDIKVC